MVIKFFFRDWILDSRGLTSSSLSPRIVCTDFWLETGQGWIVYCYTIGTKAAWAFEDNARTMWGRTPSCWKISWDMSGTGSRLNLQPLNALFLKKYFKNIFLQDVCTEIFLVNIAFMKDYEDWRSLRPEKNMPCTQLYTPFLGVDIWNWNIM